MQLEIIMPLLMGCALLWWIGGGMGWTRRLVVAAITLAVIALILIVERSMK